MTDNQSYNIVYAGAVRSGFNEDQVKQAFVTQMNIPKDKVEQLFSGRRMTLKKSLSKIRAERLQSKLLQFGAEAAIIPFVAQELSSGMVDEDKAAKVVDSAKKIIKAKPASRIQEEQSVSPSNSSQQEYDEEMRQRIQQAKIMIQTQQLEYGRSKPDDSRSNKRLIYFSVFLGAVLFFSYFYLDNFR
jgi:hypothetical protein